MKKRSILSNISKKKLQAESPDWQLYRSCSQLLMERFINCTVDKDLTQLIKFGNPPIEVLRQTWREIQEEYSELVKNEAQEHTNSLQVEIIVLQNRIFRINLAVQALQYVYSSDLVAELKEEFMPFQYNPDDPAMYYTDLQGTVDRTRGLSLKLDIKKAELTQWYAENIKSVKEVTRERFDEVLAALTESNGFMVDEREIYVTQYARLLNFYNKKMIAQQKALEKAEK